MRYIHLSRLSLIIGALCGAGGALAQERGEAFNLGEIVVIGERDDGTTNVGGSILTNVQIQTFEKLRLDQAVNLLPGVVSTFDTNGRRNESDIFVRGFGRWQVPLMIDGVRIYLPADNRIDFGRFLTADIAEIQVRKGYASVLDGPGAMGGIINLVTSKPTEPFEFEGGASVFGRSDVESMSAYLLAGSRQENFYIQGSVTTLDRDSWSLSGDYTPTPNSLEDGGERLGSDTEDWRLNFKVGFTPNDTNEYTFNYMRQQGEKGAPLNVYNNPPVPPNSFWDWPYWDVSNASFHTNTELGDAAYLKTKVYYNTFENGLDAYDDITYTTQSAMGRFHSPYDDHAYGATVEYGTTAIDRNTLKFALYYRTDVHTEWQISRPTHPTLRTEEPKQKNSQDTWSIAAENTFHVSDEIDVVAGVSYDDYTVTQAQEFSAARGLFEHPRGGADAFNWQSAFIWRYNPSAQFHASISDRARFPTTFELYSTRFGTATPNPDLGPESATNLEVGWEKTTRGNARVAGAVFYSDVQDLIQTVLLPDNTTQTQNVGDGTFYGFEASLDIPLSDRLRAGGNYTFLHREISDALQPNLRATGVPENKLFLYASWQPIERFTITPNVEAADDRWSDVNTTPVPAFPFVETGAYTLLNVDARYAFPNNVAVSFGAKNLLDDDYQLAWGFPQAGRSAYAKVQVNF